MKLKFEPVNRKHLKRLNEIVNDEQVSEFLTLVPPISMKSTIYFYKQGKKEKNYWWVSIYKGEIIGSVSLTRKGSSNKLAHLVEAGICIDRPYWHNGFGRQAMMFLKKEAAKKGFKRFELNVMKDNRRALKLYKNLGFKKEGVMKGHMKIGNKFRDSIMMSMWLGRK